MPLPPNSTVTGFADDQCTLYYLALTGTEADGPLIAQLNTSNMLVAARSVLPPPLVRLGYSLIRDLDFFGELLYVPVVARGSQRNMSLIMVCKAAALHCDQFFPVSSHASAALDSRDFSQLDLLEDDDPSDSVELAFVVADYGTRLLYGGEASYLDRLMVFDLSSGNLTRQADLMLSHRILGPIRGATLQVTGSMLIAAQGLTSSSSIASSSSSSSALFAVNLSSGQVSSVDSDKLPSSPFVTGVANMWLHDIDTGSLHISDLDTIYHYSSSC